MLKKRKKESCSHNVYIKGLCGNCGIRLDAPQSTSVSMVHSVPELKVSEDYAQDLGKIDQDKLIQERKLVLLVDLDQTILHTTHESIRGNPQVHSFELWPGHPTYYTKLRPYLKEFLERMSNIYELHIFTFGCRLYANKIASLIDPTKKYFGPRILSRDESVDQYSKTGNLNNLFPRGDSMVCIIDDRADVWRNAGNLIQVKPYTYFKTSISDGASPAGSSSAEEEESLDADVDKLEALLGVEDESEKEEDKVRQGDDTGETKDQVEAEEAAKDVTAVATSDIAEKDETSSGAAPSGDERVPESPCKEPTSDDNQASRVENPRKEEADPEPVDDDLDDYLLRLPDILARIHEKWYMELDEQRQFLVDGENYKLPDVKDIINRYLTKRYHHHHHHYHNQQSD